MGRTSSFICVLFFTKFLVAAQLPVEPKDCFSRSFGEYVKHVQTVKSSMSSLKIQDVSFPVKKDEISSQTFVRNGFLALRSDALGTVISCHGYSHSKHEGIFFRTFFPHFNLLAFDFRAHGDLIDGQYSTFGQDEIYDVYGAVEFIKSRPELADKPIIGFGFSMGAVALLQAQAHFKNLFDVLILDSPFDSSDDCMKQKIAKVLSFKAFGRVYQLPGQKLFMKALYHPKLQFLIKPLFKIASGMDPYVVNTRFVPVAPILVAPEVDVPCLFISCGKDENVTFDCVKRLYDAVSAPFKRLWITQGTKHCDSCLSQPEVYSYKLNKFIKKVLAGNWKDSEKIIDERVVLEAVK